VAELGETFATQPVAHWVDVLERAAVPGGPVLALPEVFSGPAAHAVEEIDHPTAGRLRLVATPVRIDGGRPDARVPPPRLGEHAAEILAEAGYSDEEAAALLAGPCSPE